MMISMIILCDEFILYVAEADDGYFLWSLHVYFVQQGSVQSDCGYMSNF